MNWIKNLKNKQSKISSQSGQDGVIESIFQNCPPFNKTPYYVEFGFNNTTGINANTTQLKNKGWEGLLLDGDNSNPSINLHSHFLSSQNICEIFKKYNVPKNPEYISIDVDSTDLWLFKSLVKEYKPMLFTVEYNCNFPINEAITFIDDMDASIRRAREGWARMYGASLKALNMVAQNSNYTLIAVVDKLDAFFLRNDLIGDLEVPLLEDFTNYVYPVSQNHSRQPNKELCNFFMDYEHFIQTNNIQESIEKANNSCIKYLIQ